MYLLSVSEELLQFVCGFGVLQGILLAMFIYFHPKSNRQHNRFLAPFLLMVSLVMTLPFMIRFIGWQNSYIIQPVPLAAGPLLYLYARGFRDNVRFTTVLWHLLPFFVGFFVTYWNISGYATRFPDTRELPVELLQGRGTLLINYGKLGHSIVYFFLARHALKNHVGKSGGTVTMIDPSWARLLTHGFLSIVLSAVVLFSLMVRFPQYFDILLLITVATSTPYIYAVAYKGLVKPRIWQWPETTDAKAETVEVMQQPASARVQKPVSEKLEELAFRVIRLIESDKLYQESELSVRDLASRLQIPSYLVSQALNETLNKNFYEIINAYRVEEAKRLLVEPSSREFTILSVAFEAGFNSKTTFNTVFKKFTGLTPTQYRQGELQTAAMAG